MNKILAGPSFASPIMVLAKELFEAKRPDGSSFCIYIIPDAIEPIQPKCQIIRHQKNSGGGTPPLLATAIPDLDTTNKQLFRIATGSVLIAPSIQSSTTHRLLVDMSHMRIYYGEFELCSDGMTYYCSNYDLDQFMMVYDLKESHDAKVGGWEVLGTDVYKRWKRYSNILFTYITHFFEARTCIPMKTNFGPLFQPTYSKEVPTKNEVWFGINCLVYLINQLFMDHNGYMDIFFGASSINGELRPVYVVMAGIRSEWFGVDVEEDNNAVTYELVQFRHDDNGGVQLKKNHAIQFDLKNVCINFTSFGRKHQFPSKRDKVKKSLKRKKRKSKIRSKNINKDKPFFMEVLEKIASHNAEKLLSEFTK